jgi:hypothetical protein
MLTPRAMLARRLAGRQGRRAIFEVYETPCCDVLTPGQGGHQPAPAREVRRGAMTGIFWLVTMAVGGMGGGLNAAFSDRARVWPSVVTLSPGCTRVLRIGVLGSLVIGAVAAVFMRWLIYISGTTLHADGFGYALLGFCDFFIAFVSARWITNEVDKLVLRKAVFKAASAPAAHPEVVGEMEMAPPYTLYTLVDRLMPRRAGHR